MLNGVQGYGIFEQEGEEVMNLRNVSRMWMLGIVIVLLAGLMASGCGSSKDAYVQAVYDGTLQAEPNIPIGKAFDQFFKNEKWKSFKSKEQQRIVEFNGDCTWKKQETHAVIQFTVDEDTKDFQVSFVQIGSQKMNLMESLGVVEKILKNYKP